MYKCVYLCIGMYICWCRLPCRPEEDVGFPGADNCELPNVGPWNWMRILCKSSTLCEPLSHLFSSFTNILKNYLWIIIAIIIVWTSLCRYVMCVSLCEWCLWRLSVAWLIYGGQKTTLWCLSSSCLLCG